MPFIVYQLQSATDILSLIGETLDCASVGHKHLLLTYVIIVPINQSWVSQYVTRSGTCYSVMILQSLMRSDKRRIVTPVTIVHMYNL
jgi:hypothetical protein